MNKKIPPKREKSFKMKPVNDIIMGVQTEVRKNNIKLTFTNIKIYLMFFEYINKDDVESLETARDVRFYTSIQDLASYCKCSPGMISDTIHKLKDAGILKYVTKSPDPSVILLYKKYFVEDSEFESVDDEKTDGDNDEDIYF